MICFIMVWADVNTSAQCAHKLTLMFTVLESRGICEHKSELECTLSADIHNGPYHKKLLPQKYIPTHDIFFSTMTHFIMVWAVGNTSAQCALKHTLMFTVFPTFKFLNLIASKNTIKNLNCLTDAQLVTNSSFLKKPGFIIKKRNTLKKLVVFSAIHVKLISFPKVSRQSMMQRITIQRNLNFLLANIVRKWANLSLILLAITKHIMKCNSYLSSLVNCVIFIHKNFPKQLITWKKNIILQEVSTNRTYANIVNLDGMIFIIFHDMSEPITNKMSFVTYAEKNWKQTVYYTIFPGILLRGIDSKTIRR